MDESALQIDMLVRLLVCSANGLAVMDLEMVGWARQSCAALLRITQMAYWTVGC